MGLELGQYIRSIRKEKKMSVKELHEKSQVSKSYIDYIESGAREPLPDILAKIAVVLEIPLSTLIEIQKKDQLATAINKLRSERITMNDEICANARIDEGKLNIKDKALVQAEEAFRNLDNIKLTANFIVNPDLRAIVKVGAELSREDLEKLRRVIECFYPDEFNKKNT